MCCFLLAVFASFLSIEYNYYYELVEFVLKEKLQVDFDNFSGRALDSICDEVTNL